MTLRKGRPNNDKSVAISPTTRTLVRLAQHRRLRPPPSHRTAVLIVVFDIHHPSVLLTDRVSPLLTRLDLICVEKWPLTDCSRVQIDRFC